MAVVTGQLFYYVNWIEQYVCTKTLYVNLYTHAANVSLFVAVLHMSQ